MKKIIILFLIGILSLNVYAAKPKKKIKHVKRKAEVEHSIVVANQSINQFTLETNADTVRSMASITKLMTAMVVLDQLPNPLRTITLKQSYMGRKEYTIGELLKLMLVRSDNYAAEILSKNILGSRDEFIKAMNDKARSIGMWSAEFQDPTGLLAGNSATARDISKMVTVAGTYPDIRASAQPELELEVSQGRKTRTVNVNNTNKTILQEFGNILVSKTGTTNAAGKCLALLVEKQGQQYAVVILGEPNKQQRDLEARHLLQNYLRVNDNYYSGI